MELDLNSVPVINNEQARRFEATVDGQKAFLNYKRFPDHIEYLHVEVPLEFEGKGLAGKITKTALDFARENGLRVVPKCPYVRVYLRKHPEYQDLVSGGS